MKTRRQIPAHEAAQPDFVPLGALRAHPAASPEVQAEAREAAAKVLDMMRGQLRRLFVLVAADAGVPWHEQRDRRAGGWMGDLISAETALENAAKSMRGKAVAK